MLIAINSEGHYITADKANGHTFMCPVCLSPVVLKKGRFKIAHFSHQRIKDCYKATYKQESAAHLAGKHALYRLCQHEHVAMEYYIDEIEQIPDILVNHRFALELQLSVIPVDKLLGRTYGYRSINMDVVWIASEQAIKKDNGTVKLTLFQRSMVDAVNRLLITYDTAGNCFYLYELTAVQQNLSLSYRRRPITDITQLICREVLQTSAYKSYHIINQHERSKYISTCLSQRSVLEPTLSALYQLNIHWRQLPKEIGIIVPSQFYIRTHPIRWQSRLRLLLYTGSFSLQRFIEELEFYSYYAIDCSELQISARLLKEYKEAVRKLYVQI
ncbi:competence protein CoiA [Macrococcus lamae]|uniref:Competence protein CoiA n=1 Tax=Macrococcus lamae TaxID=198484 RepID=A0A4R6BVU9_9STAP|nr:competence protein CoiA family protein [Macrococcus lamae]TDM12444.1 hypothetical protein ERX29_03735 [Macrococcus lamae]